MRAYTMKIAGIGVVSFLLAHVIGGAWLRIHWVAPLDVKIAVTSYSIVLICFYSKI